MEVCHQEIKFLDKNNMEFSIGAQFSREFSFEETKIVDKLKDILNLELKEKIYNENIIKIYCSFICVSKGFEPFFMVRPLKIYRNEPAIEYEIKLDFETFFKANEEDRFKILKEEFIKNSRETLDSKKLKNFDLFGFISDLNNILYYD